MEHTQDKTTSFKELARLARRRMKNGYWQSENKERETIICSSVARGANIERINELYAKKLERELYSVSSKSDLDEVLYKKVCKLLDENEYVLNPIKHLIDHDSFDSLDAIAKQNYIFKLADKYNSLKERYQEEKALRKNII